MLAPKRKRNALLLNHDQKYVIGAKGSRKNVYLVIHSENEVHGFGRKFAFYSVTRSLEYCQVRTASQS